MGEITEALNETLETRLKKNKLSKSWVVLQMRRNGENLSSWQIYNAGIPGRMEEGRANRILNKCLEVVDAYEKRMGFN